LGYLTRVSAPVCRSTAAARCLPAPAGAGRPREKGDRLPSLAGLSATAVSGQVTVAHYGKTASIQAAGVTCLWHSVFGTRPVTVALIRDRTKTGYDWPWSPRTPQPAPPRPSSATQQVERRGRGRRQQTDLRRRAGPQPHRPRRRACHPVQLACQAVAVTWYATAGHHPADVEDHRARAPWYRAKARPSTADMAAKLRRVLIAARFQASRPDQPTPEEINVIRLAWEGLAA